MSSPNTSKRLYCARCLRPQRTCICQWVTPLEHDVEVLFLQHPLEVHNAKNSARLLHMSLPHSRLVVGETFSAHELQALLYAPFDSANEMHASDKTAYPILLYPENSEEQGLIALPPVAQIPSEMRIRLIVLDGTWRKSRKMLYLNPLLQQLPRLTLRDPPSSHYRIRKAHKADQLSSFEATCYALMQLEENIEKYKPLLAAFDGFVAQQQAHVGMQADMQEHE
ncbi:tRNA-uridine aminocarboxypropyltransferase [Herminiimonas sp. NPDC097707]|uniref:tRNA-uridine aminocarboxypropyltransferase n=1 Tax=Herminiimonas sp. NPDC097707 TaxID=3364007 RepID=UPI00383B3C35